MIFFIRLEFEHIFLFSINIYKEILLSLKAKLLKSRPTHTANGKHFIDVCFVNHNSFREAIKYWPLLIVFSNEIYWSWPLPHKLISRVHSVVKHKITVVLNYWLRNFKSSTKSAWFYTDIPNVVVLQYVKVIIGDTAALWHHEITQFSISWTQTSGESVWTPARLPRARWHELLEF